jgi:nucleoside-diphosphate-sugar epimerase
MRILVIGGTGFIGSPLVAELRQLGPEVKTFARHGDIAGDRNHLAESSAPLLVFNPDVVVDVIPSSGRQARALVELFRGRASRIVALSSGDVYRSASVFHRLEEGELEPVPLSEDSSTRTTAQTYPRANIEMLQSIFGWLDDEYDKLPVERAILGAGDPAGTILRLPMVYGPGDRLHRLGALVAHMQRTTGDLAIAQSVAQWRAPRGFVDNVAHAVALAATNPRAAGRIYNVAEPQNLSELEVAERVAAAMAWRGSIVVKPDADVPDPRLASNLAQHWSVDSGRIRGELDYREIVDVEEAIRRTVAWELSV